MTEKLTKVEIADIFLYKYGEVEPIFIFRPNRPWILWQKYDMNCHQGRRQDICRLYGYVSKISSRNWAYKSLILVARAVIKATAIAIFTKSIEEAEIKNLLTVDSASVLIFNL